MGKKHKKHGRRNGAPNDWGMAQQYGGWPGAGYDAGQAAGMGAAPGMGAGTGPGMTAGMGPDLGLAGLDAGFLQGLPAMLRSRHTEQFLLGALLGAAAAWVLADEELRGKLVKAGIKLYSGLAGGIEEMKEQMADIKAEVEAERHGDA
ncbi:hypothetical protein [Pseudothauera rhizosphaerae]|uniref:Uncharacterized protein n=1 Tax=Pseudothauera rhizosphaerae TaxID=2565932 RepID=A0A4S4ATQ6_9RHOO|nr:hypothetical protein [Pseudothauera rhizosphaerae]THF63258.1 hypothetical protein E6O51_04100 [Pseudothauera rhizosphaerae]